MKTEKIDGLRLREDREALNYSRDSFLEMVLTKTGSKVSLSTLIRAEQGKCSKPNLRLMCKVIGFVIETYLNPQSLKEKETHAFELSGKWRSYFIEDDMGSAPYLTIEDLYLNQNNQSVEGIYEVFESYHPDGWVRKSSYKMEGFTSANIIIGKYYVDGRREPAGLGVFQLIISPLGDFAEGFCSSYSDDSDLTLSRNVWLRTDSLDFSAKDKKIRKKMELESIIRAPVIFRG